MYRNLITTSVINYYADFSVIMTLDFGLALKIRLIINMHIIHINTYTYTHNNNNKKIDKDYQTFEASLAFSARLPSVLLSFFSLFLSCLKRSLALFLSVSLASGYSSSVSFRSFLLSTKMLEKPFETT